MVEEVIPHFRGCVRSPFSPFLLLKNKQSDPIGIQNGVKQGDPMSPILFDLSVDSLLHKLEEDGEGFQHCVRNITTVAFADDLVLLRMCVLTFLTLLAVASKLVS